MDNGVRLYCEIQSVGIGYAVKILSMVIRRKYHSFLVGFIKDNLIEDLSHNIFEYLFKSGCKL